MTPSTLQSLRRWHLYVGVFLAPAILFFALTGFIQVVGWQDQRNPPPPAWVSWMAGIHKHQAAPASRKPRPQPAPAPAAGQPRGEDHDEAPFVPLKVFALLTAIGLFVTTLMGLAVALGIRSMRRTVWLILAAGVVVPAVLMAL